MGQLGRSIAPGPTGRLIAEAARQGASGGTSAALFGLAAALLAGTFAMAQIERSANRLAGSTRDRPAVRRFVVAFLVAATVGVLLVAGALLLGAGRALATGFGVRDTAEVAWSILRWPIGVLVVLLAVTLLYSVAPRHRIGSTRAVFAGTAVAVVLWVAFTGLLSLYFSLSSSSAYGPLLAIVALLVWSMLTSVALHLGDRDGVRALGCPAPRPCGGADPDPRSSRPDAVGTGPGGSVGRGSLTRRGLHRLGLRRIGGARAVPSPDWSMPSSCRGAPHDGHRHARTRSAGAGRACLATGL